MDLYEYCGDDPTMYLDPAGTDWGEAPNVPGGPQCLSLGSCHRPGFNPFDPQPGPATPAPATPPPTPTPAPAAPTPVDCNKCGLWPVDQFRPSLCDCGNLGLLDRGCIGLCQIRMGLPGILDPQNAWGVRCFKSYGEARKVLLQLKKNSGCHPLLFAVQTTASGSATTTDPGRGEIDPGTIPIAPPATDPKNPTKWVPCTFNYATLLGTNNCYYWECMNNGKRTSGLPQMVYHDCKLVPFGTTYYCVYPNCSAKNGCGGSPSPDIPNKQLPR